MSGRNRRGHAGFTLIEVMFVVLATAATMTVAVRFYFQVASASTAAANLTQEGRRAVAIADRVARDLEGTVLIRKPPEVDPLAHPWLFLAEGGDLLGADRLKFSSRSHRPRASDAHESDLQHLAYWTRPGEEGGTEILRFASGALPEELDRSFPTAGQPGVMLLADGVAAFGVKLLDSEGEWVSEWDSSTILRSGDTPVAAEISVAVLPDGVVEPELEPEPVTRRVLIPVRPLDLQEVLEAAQGDEDEDPDCVTVEECISNNSEVFDLYFASLPNRDQMEDIIASIANQCFSDHAETLPVEVEGCE